MTVHHAVYIHVPFCRRKCGYCSFVSAAGREHDIPRYIDALCAEIKRRADSEPVCSIFFGGGTPSLLSVAQFKKVLDAVRAGFLVDDGAEISFEANPGTVDAAYLSGLRAMGANRLSLGVQSFNDAELASIGRIHSADEARRALSAARDAGFTNVNLDLIYGLPGQTTEQWRHNIEQAIELRPEHLSLYALTLEPDTPIGRAVEQGTIPEPDPDTAADMYELAETLLADAGYRHYEISNWSLPGYECRHNLVYWHNEPYFGFGAAAHSSLAGHRIANTADINEYIFAGGEAVELDETISPALQHSETVILGLRLIEGIDIEATSSRLGVDIMQEFAGPFEAMVAAGLLEQAENYLRLTPRGRLLSNEVFWRLLPEEAVAGI